MVANLSGQPARVDLAADTSLLAGRVLLAAGSGDPPTRGADPHLAPWESRVLLAHRAG